MSFFEADLTNAAKYTERGTVTLTANVNREGDAILRVLPEELVERGGGAVGFGISDKTRQEIERELSEYGVSLSEGLKCASGDFALYGQLALIFTERHEPLKREIETLLNSRDYKALTYRFHSLKLPAKPVVLVVDDDVGLLKMAKIILAPHYEVSLASSGEDALLSIERGVTPDIVLLDISMPGMDGYETLENFESSGVTSASGRARRRYGIGRRRRLACTRAGLGDAASCYIWSPLKTH